MAAAEFEHKVSIWDLDSGEKISEFETVLDFGGKRILLSHDGKLCITAAYDKYGLVCYSTDNGRALWNRGDISKVQVLTISKDGEKVYCGNDSGPCNIIDIKTGKDLAKIRGVQAVYESLYEEIVFEDRKNPVLRYQNGSKIAEIKRESFAILSVIFGIDSLCLSESGGFTRFIECCTGKEIWRYVPPKGSHIIHLGYLERMDKFAGIEWPYEKGDEMKLLMFDQKTQRSVTVIQFESQAAVEFTSSGEMFINSDGTIRNTSTGEVIKKLPF